MQEREIQYLETSDHFYLTIQVSLKSIKVLIRNSGTIQTEKRFETGVAINGKMIGHGRLRNL
jgi:hypothetical protein